VLALLKGEVGSARVEELVGEDAIICSVNLGEVLYVLTRTHGEDVAIARVDGVRQVVRIVDPDWPLVRLAAGIKARGGLSYADAFCIATAELHDADLATGDPEIIGFDGPVRVIDLRGS